jgi:hypothetical protein
MVTVYGMKEGEYEGQPALVEQEELKILKSAQFPGKIALKVGKGETLYFDPFYLVSKIAEEMR